MQTYVKSLCDQNQKCKEFIKNNVEENKAEKFIFGLQHNEPQEDSSEAEEDENEIDDEN